MRMFESIDQAYLCQRADEERRKAERAPDSCAARAHLDLARECERRYAANRA